MSRPPIPTDIPFSLAPEDWEPERADWGLWALILKGELWEAVMLALGYDPDSFRPDGEQRIGNVSLRAGEFAWPLPVAGLQLMRPLARKRVETLLRTAESHLDDTLPVLSRARPPRPTFASIVRFHDFAAWAEGLGISLPSSFPRVPPNRPAQLPVVAVVAVATGAKGWPWGQHETKLLRELAAAAEHFWTKYDPKFPATAPTSEDVVAWLVGRGIGKRVAEAIAQILRADGLPAGPRVNK